VRVNIEKDVIRRQEGYIQLRGIVLSTWIERGGDRDKSVGIVLIIDNG